MMKIEFAAELRREFFDVSKRIDNEGDVLGTVSPCLGIGERLAKGAAEGGIGNGVGMRRMNAYISVAGPEFAEGRVRILRRQGTVGEDDDRKRPYAIRIIDFDWDVFIARRVVQYIPERENLIRP